MSFFQPAPEPKSNLGYHRILSPSAGVRVSPLCLGAMNFGTAWEGFMGKCDKDTAFGILDFFYDNGGNFIDTREKQPFDTMRGANNYQNEQSEEWIGEWTEKRGNRDELVLASKVTMGYRNAHRDEQLQSNFQGNSAKSLRVSLNASLKKLRTDYLDILYVHWWDFSTSIPELMKALNAVADAGKVLYLGVSDTPAWIVSKANEYARQNGLRQFVVYQGKWSASFRDMEREIIPMTQAEGMGIAPWGALGGGNFKTEEQRKSGEGRQMGPPSDVDSKVSVALEKIANKKNTAITSIALAYVMHKAPYVFPICGGRKIDHLKGNIEALSVELTKEDIDEIEDAVPFDPGFPMNFLFMTSKYNPTSTKTENVTMVKMNALLDTPDSQTPVKPRPLK